MQGGFALSRHEHPVELVGSNRVARCVSAHVVSQLRHLPVRDTLVLGELGTQPQVDHVRETPFAPAARRDARRAIGELPELLDLHVDFDVGFAPGSDVARRPVAPELLDVARAVAAHERQLLVLEEVDQHGRQLFGAHEPDEQAVLVRSELQQCHRALLRARHILHAPLGIQADCALVRARVERALAHERELRAQLTDVVEAHLSDLDGGLVQVVQLQLHAQCHARGGAVARGRVNVEELHLGAARLLEDGAQRLERQERTDVAKGSGRDVHGEQHLPDLVHDRQAVLEQLALEHFERVVERQDEGGDELLAPAVAVLALGLLAIEKERPAPLLAGHMARCARVFRL